MKFKIGQLIAFIEKVTIILSSLWLTGGNDIRFLAFIAYPTTVFFLLLRWKQTLWALIQEKFLWLFIGLLLLSVLWAADFEESLYMSLKLVATLLIGFSLGVRYSLKEQLQILAWAFGLAVILSLFYCLVLPQKGIMFGAWRGIYAQKNYLGRMMTCSTMIFLLQAISYHRYRLLNLFFVTLSFALVVLSTSTTSLFILFTLLAVLPLYRALRWSYSWIIPFFSVVIISVGSLSLLLVSQLESFFAVFGKDATLTGRIPLWEKVFAKFLERLWFGYGYGGFWTGWDGEAADIWRTEKWEPPSAHNGLLDLGISVGLIGVVLAILALATIIFRSLYCLRSTKSVSGIWPLWFLTLLMLANITETTMQSRSIFWAFYIAVAISTHRKIINQYTPISESSKKL